MDDYILYKHTGPTGKVYIGITQQRPSKRFQGGKGYKHCPHMKSAIEKYGWASFTTEIIYTHLTKEEAQRAEIQLISIYKSNDPKYGYNLDLGGSAPGRISEETRRKLSESKRGAKNPSVLYGSPMKGLHHTDKTKALMSKRAKARRTPCSDKKRDSLMAANAKLQTPVLCVETGVVYPGLHYAERETGVPATKICAVCKGRRKSAGGYRWEYMQDGGAT